eukprot:CAMPEP_0119128914 /NCGR_PEP_ID=MMETSP1310-20130426/6878_1 /TAXON_ID=464262 /ORGANISM="Genus nov. species nov., Strain RCC2339" /LENGTH=165 /DNA_ID=CAMNT_0007119299 /DNA_START=232 /DNA_END=725 /DNA_ORIENTATION=+
MEDETMRMLAAMVEEKKRAEKEAAAKEELEKAGETSATKEGTGVDGGKPVRKVASEGRRKKRDGERKGKKEGKSPNTGTRQKREKKKRVSAGTGLEKGPKEKATSRGNKSRRKQEDGHVENEEDVATLVPTSPNGNISSSKKFKTCNDLSSVPDGDGPLAKGGAG